MRNRVSVLAVLLLVFGLVVPVGAGPAEAVVDCDGLTVTLVVDASPFFGTDGDDVILGTPGDDIIMGTPGNDHIVGASGNDRICGNGGNDHIAGEPQGEAKGHADAPGQSNPKAKGRNKSK